MTKRKEATYRMREFLKYMFTKYTVLLYLFSTLFLFLATQLPSPTGDVLRIVGTGIFITTFVSSALNFYFQMDINRYFSIISGAERAWIRRVYDNRKEAMREIDSEFEKAHGSIELLCISGTDFFHSKLLTEIDKMCLHDSNNSVRVLLLDPRSKHAVDRALIEEGIDLAATDIAQIPYPTTAMCRNTLYSVDQLERILDDARKKNKQNFQIEIRTYDTAPILLLAKVNGRVFVEQYHYGITEEERQTSLTKCLGKKVPVLEFCSDSVPGQLWLSHFDYLWTTSSRRKLYPGFCSWVQKKLREEKAWLDVYRDSKAISDRQLGVAIEGSVGDRGCGMSIP